MAAVAATVGTAGIPLALAVAAVAATEGTAALAAALAAAVAAATAEMAGMLPLALAVAADFLQMEETEATIPAREPDMTVLLLVAAAAADKAKETADQAAMERALSSTRK